MNDMRKRDSTRTYIRVIPRIVLDGSTHAYSYPVYDKVISKRKFSNLAKIADLSFFQKNPKTSTPSSIKDATNDQASERLTLDTNIYIF